MDFLGSIHPRVVHFAIALLITYSVLEIISVIIQNESLSRTAYIILILGIAGAVAAVLTGNQAEEIAELWEENGALIPFGAISEHENYATITLWFFTGVLVLRTFLLLKKKFVGIIKYIFIVLALTGIFLVYETGEHGGELVYKHGVGTDLLKPENPLTK